MRNCESGDDGKEENDGTHYDHFDDWNHDLSSGMVHINATIVECTPSACSTLVATKLCGLAGDHEAQAPKNPD
jgi:hypothetical protein